MKIATIVVTYNRINILRQGLLALTNQSRPSDSIIVVDNGSNDGTEQMVREQFSVVDYIKLKENEGLFGGLHVGMDRAYRQGYNAMWLMDDDAEPRKDALEKLLEVVNTENNLKNACVYCANVTRDERLFAEPVNIKLGKRVQVYSEFHDKLKDKIFECEWGGNAGAFIPRGIVAKVGLPRADMFFCGEPEYISRIKRAGFKFFRYFGSIVYHERKSKFKILRLPTGFFKLKKPFWKEYLISPTSVWREHYAIRNKMYTYCRKYREFAKLYKYIFFTLFEIIVKLYYGDSKVRRFIYLLKGLYDGLLGNLGKGITR